MRWAARREAQPSRAIEALGKEIFFFFAFLVWVLGFDRWSAILGEARRRGVDAAR
jgi:hypothetical protein